jgi:hypothetical protein
MSTRQAKKEQNKQLTEQSDSVWVIVKVNKKLHFFQKFEKFNSFS